MDSCTLNVVFDAFFKLGFSYTYHMSYNSPISHMGFANINYFPQLSHFPEYVL